MVAHFSLLELCAGLGSLGLGFQLIYLRRRLLDYSSSACHWAVCLLLGASALFFILSATLGPFGLFAKSGVHAAFALFFLLGVAFWAFLLTKRVLVLLAPATLDSGAAGRESHKKELEASFCRCALETAKWQALNTELAREKRALEALVEAIPLPIVAMSATGVITVWNPAAEKLFGWTEREAKGHANRIIPPDRQDEHAYIVKASAKGESVIGLKTKRIRKDGNVVDVCIWNTPFGSNEIPSERMNSLAIFEDITKKKTEASALEKATRTAEDASAAKTMFLANMSHEIRTPLSVIIGFAELLKSDFHMDSRALHRIEAIHRNGLLLNGLINDILDVSKIEAGEMSLDLNVVNVREALEDLMTMFSFKATAKNIGFEIVVSEDLPEQFVCDQTRLMQILINVVGNAIKFTDQGQVKLSVSFDDKIDQAFVFLVEDSGPGLLKLSTDHLFKPFSQLTVAPTRGGSGLGLYLSKKIATILGGKVTLLQPTADSGARFQIRLPAKFSDADASVVRTGLKLPAWRSEVLRGCAVLLAEDNVDNQQLVVHLLQEIDAKVDVVGDGEKAFEMALRHDYDVILMDVQMPKMNGYQVAKALRERGYAKKIIAVSAFRGVDEETLCREAGCDDFVSKTASANELFLAIERCLVNGRYDYRKD